MNRMTKASIMAGIAGKMAYVATSVFLITKSVGKKAYNKLNYRASYYVTISSKENGLVLMDDAKKTTNEIVGILESMKDANIVITLERSK